MCRPEARDGHGVFHSLHKYFSFVKTSHLKVVQRVRRPRVPSHTYSAKVQKQLKLICSVFFYTFLCIKHSDS